MKILLTTLHSKYSHSSLALPSLAAALPDELRGLSIIREFTVNEPQDKVLQEIVAEQPTIAAFSCYIWNIEATLRLISDLKKVTPETFIILGGPEVSWSFFELMKRYSAVDCIIRGEGEQTFAEIVKYLVREGSLAINVHILNSIPGIAFRDAEDIIATPERLPEKNLDVLPSPVALGLIDYSKPLIYWETSRGCPFSCAFCISSLEKGVRSYSMERIETDLRALIAQGQKTIKLVDRTFNYDAERANGIWELILRENRECTFHFEIAADLLTERNLEVLRKVPAGMFRFEIGVQSTFAETLDSVGRKSDLEKLFANVAMLLRETQVTVHLDLVAGLPGEDFAGFTESLQRLLAASPHHIQVEPLKVLKGAPMRKIATAHDYAWSATPPYRILRTPWLSFEEICRIETIGDLLEIFYNTGRFRSTLRILADTRPLAEIFVLLADFWERKGSVWDRSQKGLFEAFWAFAAELSIGDEMEALQEALSFDYCLVEYPSPAKPPSFFTLPVSPEQGKVTLPPNIAARATADGAQVRTFSATFSRDYQTISSPQTPTTLTFYYLAAPGKGLSVICVEKHDTTCPLGQ